MINSKIREQGNSYVVTIPRDQMERYGLNKGDSIGFVPIKQETRYILRPEVQQALNDVLENDRDALELLAK